MSEFQLIPDMIGMNNYEYYVPEVCNGHHCPRDCEICELADEAMEFIAEQEDDEDGI